MRNIINKNTVASIKQKDKQYEIRDTKLRGFAIKVYPSGKASYVVWYGRGKAYTIGDIEILSPTQARGIAIKKLGEVKNGIDPIEQKRKEKEEKEKSKRDSLSFGRFVENDYFPWALKHHRSGKETVNKIKRNFLPLLKDKKLTEITPWTIDKWRSKRLKEGIKIATINRELTTIKAALYKAVEWGKADQNPLAGFKLQRVDSQPKVRFLTDDEEKRLRKALDAREAQIRAERDNANQWRAERDYELFEDLRKVEFADHLKPIVLLSLNTGCRRGELFNLQWDDIDFERQIMTIQGNGTKSGKTLHIPLNKEALDILLKWHKQSNGSALVFVGKNGERMNNCTTSWQAVLKEANITNFRWHDMRHHFASRLVMAGVDLATVRELLGHADYKMTLRYSHLGDHIKKQAVEKLVKK